MSKIYKTSKGKSIDIDKLKLANENTIAVGNMKINARGDELGPGGKVVATKNQVADQTYTIPPYTPNSAMSAANEAKSNAQQLNDIVENLTNPALAPTAAEVAATPSTRGSLADSVAKTTAVNQELLKPIGKRNQGPSRI